MKRITIVLVLVLSMCLSVIVRAEDVSKEDRIAEIERQIAELQAELKELKGETEAAEGDILFQDDTVIIKYAGISGDEKSYKIMFEVESLISDKTLLIQNRETSINGYMAEVYLNATVAPGKKAKEGITVSGDKAHEYPLEGIESLETKFFICDKEHMATDNYTTEAVVIK